VKPRFHFVRQAVEFVRQGVEQHERGDSAAGNGQYRSGMNRAFIAL